MENVLKPGGISGRVLRGRTLHLPREVGVAAIGIAVGIALGIVVAAASPLYTIGGLIGLVGLYCVFADVRFALFGFVGVATILPFGTIPLSLGPVRPTLLDVCLVSLLLVSIFRLLANPQERLRSSGVDLPVLVFIGISITSFVLGTAYQTTTSDARQFGEILDAIILFFTTVNCVRDARTVRLLLIALVAGGAAAGAIGIVLYYLPGATTTSLLLVLSHVGYPSENILQYNPGTTVERAIGTSIDPNILGAIVMMSGVVAVGLFLAAPSRRQRLMLLASLVPMLAALLLTYSRGSLIGFVAGCAVIATLRYRRLWLLAGLLAAAIVLSPQLAQSSFLTHLQSGIEIQDQAAAMRLGEYKDAFRLISEYPWFGVGFGSAPQVDLYVGVSSTYLIIAEQVGLVGLTVWFWAMVSIVVRGLRASMQAPGETSALALTCLATLASALVAGVFDHHFADFPHVVALVWMICGLMMIVSTAKASGVERRGAEI